MNSEDRRDPDYSLGYSSAELRRLGIQHELYGSFTRELFVEAGLSPGMKILDIGSGAGDVSMLAAELVGPRGSVVGVEINPQAIETASTRVRESGYNNARFELGDVRDTLADGEFDAVIGRWILMWVADPVALLNAAKGYLRPNGIIAFQESEFTCGPTTFPETPLFRQVAQWSADIMDQGGPDFHMGYKLHKTFLDAGLPSPQLVFHTPIGSGQTWSGFEYLAETVRRLLPRLQQLGVAGPNEIEIDTLADRLRDEAGQAESVATMPAVIGAWSHNS